eukprot:TRINITY_DN17952_c0_g1_i1.p1 TRINITY_DN17952_c0_g1~~TRINITY_DN17952_c0_g1_i1.p1  ORF type:complete len:160 (-),score=13.66 TRINITY_DN17952_c0_g1_i1:21-500(-)
MLAYVEHIGRTYVLPMLFLCIAAALTGSLGVRKRLETIAANPIIPAATTLHPLLNGSIPQEVLRGLPRDWAMLQEWRGEVEWRRRCRKGAEAWLQAQGGGEDELEELVEWTAQAGKYDATREASLFRLGMARSPSAWWWGGKSLSISHSSITSCRGRHH